MTSLFTFIRHRYDKLKGDTSHSHPKESEIRQKLKRELYEYNKELLYHGFPNKPSAMAYDPKLQLIAIGTRIGGLRIYGAPGVEFFNNEPGDTITKLLFLEDQGRLISLSVQNELILWEINCDDFNSKLEKKNEFLDFPSEGSPQNTISELCLYGSDNLLIGTEGGNIYTLNLTTFKLSDFIISHDLIVKEMSEEFKLNPGAVEAIEVRPTELDQILMGYNRGVVCLWNVRERKVISTFNTTQQLEALTWHSNGGEFMTAHSDGSYMIWDVEDSSQPKQNPLTQYGPFPCKAITNIKWKTVDCNEESDPIIVFSGGMPRGSYGDRYTVSIIHGEKHSTLDFTSRVIDLKLLCTSEETHDLQEEHGENGEPDSSSRGDRPHTLLILLEEELVMIDLLANGWPQFKLPYLNSIHASAITATSHVTNVPESLWKKILEAGANQFSSYSKRAWPINGGERGSNSENMQRDLLLTGHEDGSVKFWDIGSTTMSLLYKVNTARFFIEGFVEQAPDDEEEWPPFRKVGFFDPFTDDPRLGIQKIFLCPISDILVIGGTAGQVIVLQMERDEREQEIKLGKANLVSDRDNFVWRGHDALTIVEGENTYSPGFQPQCVLQVHPPACTTALAVHTEWQLLSVGTAHGFCIFDFCQRHTISVTCTLGVSETSATDDSAMSRRKSFKKSLRESFRRLRRRRSMNKGDKKKGEGSSHTANRLQEIKSDDTNQRAISSPRGASRKLPPTSIEEDFTPAERAIEDKTLDKEGMAINMIKCLHFADTYLTPTVHGPSLLAGSQHGKIFIFSITLPAYDKRDMEDVTAKISKEITLRHNAPVISLTVLDTFYYPLPHALEVQNGRAKAPDMNGNHRLLVISEEQFKIFSLPTLKPEDKWKLTAHEGQRVRKTMTCTFRSRSDDQYSEIDVACVTNLGQLSVYTIKGLRRQINADAICKTDINGIATCIFTSNGEGFYQKSSSEYVRFSLSASKITRPMCKLNLKQQYRTPLGTPQIIVENYDETHSLTQADMSPSVEQSFMSADMTQDDVTDYNNVARVTESSGNNSESNYQALTNGTGLDLEERTEEITQIVEERANEERDVVISTPTDQTGSEINISLKLTETTS